MGRVSKPRLGLCCAAAGSGVFKERVRKPRLIRNVPGVRMPRAFLDYVFQSQKSSELCGRERYGRDPPDAQGSRQVVQPETFRSPGF